MQSSSKIPLQTVLYLAALCSFGSLVNDLYLPSLPMMQAEFGVSPSTVQLGLSFGMIGLGLGELFWGPLSDKTGRKPVLYMSFGLFTLAALASVFSSSIAFFLACRLIQGLGASGAVLLARAIPSDNYAGKDLVKIMALIGAINGIAPGGGPILGGFMADSIGWRGIFAVLAALAVLMILLGHHFPESLPVVKRKNASMLQLMLEFLPLLRNRKFMIHVTLKGAALGTLFCYVSGAPFIIEVHFGYSPSQFGTIIGLNAFAIALGSIVCLKFKTMKLAAVVGATGMALFSIAFGIAIYFLDSFLVFEALIIPMLFCSGLVFASSNTLAMSESKGASGAASAILGLMGYLFGCIVSPIVGMGDILLSTSIMICLCAAITLWFGFWPSG